MLFFSDDGVVCYAGWGLYTGWEAFLFSFFLFLFLIFSIFLEFHFLKLLPAFFREFRSSTPKTKELRSSTPSDLKRLID